MTRLAMALIVNEGRHSTVARLRRHMQDDASVPWRPPLAKKNKSRSVDGSLDHGHQADLTPYADS
jgi:hypothetical protein